MTKFDEAKNQSKLFNNMFSYGDISAEASGGPFKNKQMQEKKFYSKISEMDRSSKEFEA